jgi:hypothetical protein
VSITVTLFLVLLSAISDTSLSPPQPDPYFIHYLPHTFPLSRVPVSFLVLLVMLRVHVSCCPIFPPSPFLSSRSSDPFPVHLPQRWATYLLQTPLFLSLFDFTHRHFTLLSITSLPSSRSGLGFCLSPTVNPHSSCPYHNLSDHRLELFLDRDRTSRSVCPPSPAYSHVKVYTCYSSKHVASAPVIPYISPCPFGPPPFLSFQFS